MQQITANNFLSLKERQLLTQKNDFRASLEVLKHLAWIVFAFALVYFWTNPISIIVALFVLGGQQLACAILMHDAGHFGLFSNRSLNDWVGNWLGAYPIFQNMMAYRPYHLIHHLHTGTEEDPDLFLTRGYPTSKKSMMRKFARDLAGVTGLKSYFGLFAMYAGVIKYNLSGKIQRSDDFTLKIVVVSLYKKMAKPLLVNMILFAILYFLGAAWLYALWLGAMLTTYQFSLRVRSIAEHSIVEDQTDPYRNTRTTYTNFLERLLFAPYYVNYHAEHHLLMSVPSYNLPKMHQMIKDRGFYEKGVLAKNYWEIIKLAAQKDTAN